MRATVIVNPHATATTERRRALLIRALAGSMTLTEVRTERRGHATDLAAAAAHEGADLIVVHGGDGTVNEVVNGIMALPSGTPRPLLAVVPGGSTNVFARAVGIDPDPTEAASQILEGLAADRTRTVSLGRVGERYFTFNAGLGLDAEVVRAVEQHRARGRTISNSLHIRRAIREFFRADRKHPRLTVTVDGRELADIHLALISNVDPWTYAGARAVHTNPTLPADRGLGLFALTSLRTLAVVRILRQITAAGATDPHSAALIRIDAASEITVRATEPLALQVDGDYLGEYSSARFMTIPEALRIVI